MLRLESPLSTLSGHSLHATGTVRNAQSGHSEVPGPRRAFTASTAVVISGLIRESLSVWILASLANTSGRRAHSRGSFPGINRTIAEGCRRRRAVRNGS
jgi:hypothetical protein